MEYSLDAYFDIETSGGAKPTMPEDTSFAIWNIMREDVVNLKALRERLEDC